jgi:hypothetical protein
MANPVANFIAYLGGGDRVVLERVPSERIRFVQMAGVLFTTAGIAAISMMFALYNGVHASLTAAILLGLAWGAIIFNLDRFLVLSMGDTRTKGWRLFWLALPRFMLAAIIAAVVSTPLVLRIFATDINEQLATIHQKESSQFKTLLANGADQHEASVLAMKISTDQAILSGHPPQAIVSPQLQQAQTRTQNLQQVVTKDQTTADYDYGRWQCEQDGQTCDGGSGMSGNGARAHTRYLEYQQAESIYKAAQAQLSAAQQTESSDQKAFSKYQSGRLSALRVQASAALPGLQKEYNALENKIQGAISNDDKVNSQNSGILAQLQALSAASAANGGLAAAHWTVLALFFMIEILPVTIKILLNLGRQTTYEKVAIEMEEVIADREYARRVEAKRIEEDESQARIKDAQDRIKIGNLQSDAQMKIEEGKADTRVKVEDDMRLREQDVGKYANGYVADEMTKIVEVALKDWGDRVRTDLSEYMASSGNGNGSKPHTETKPGFDLPNEDLL